MPQKSSLSSPKPMGRLDYYYYYTFRYQQARECRASGTRAMMLDVSTTTSKSPPKVSVEKVDIRPAATQMNSWYMGI